MVKGGVGVAMGEGMVCIEEEMWCGKAFVRRCRCSEVMLSVNMIKVFYVSMDYRYGEVQRTVRITSELILSIFVVLFTVDERLCG